MRHYCTYFDSHYASRALALHASLRRHGHPFKLWALCLDDEVHDFITGLELNDVVAFKLVDLEAQFPALSVAKTTRSRIEFYFTCTPFLPAFVFQHEASAELVTYLDADLFFYSSIEPLFAEFGDASVGIIAHRWPKGREGMVVYGIYNVGLIIFRRDEHASKCLAWWGERCLASCCTDPARGVYGDQKYLDEWPQLFHGVKVLQHKGGNVGVWNIGNHPVGYQGSTLLIGDEPLVFFHFHGLKRVGSKYFDLHLVEHEQQPSGPIFEGIFAPYIIALLAIERRYPWLAAKAVPESEPGKLAHRLARSLLRNRSPFRLFLKGHYARMFGHRPMVVPRCVASLLSAA